MTCARLNHPDPVYGYRLEHDGQSIVYATDTEHFACVDPTLKKLAAGADILIYDAQYTPDEYPAKVGWGHSTWAAGAELARAAGVPQLVLFHHDPARTDDALAALEADGRARIAGHGRRARGPRAQRARCRKRPPRHESAASCDAARDVGRAVRAARRSRRDDRGRGRARRSAPHVRIARRARARRRSRHAVADRRARPATFARASRRCPRCPSSACRRATASSVTSRRPASPSTCTMPPPIRAGAANRSAHYKTTSILAAPIVRRGRCAVCCRSSTSTTARSIRATKISRACSPSRSAARSTTRRCAATTRSAA